MPIEELEKAQKNAKQTLTRLTERLPALDQVEAQAEGVIRTVTHIQQQLNEVRSLTVQAIENYRDLLGVVSRQIRGDETP